MLLDAVQIGLGIDEALYPSFRTTSPIENLNGLIAHYTRTFATSNAGRMARWCFARWADP